MHLNYSFFLSFSVMYPYYGHFSLSLNTVGFRDTHLCISVNLWCKMHCNNHTTNKAAIT